MLDPRRGEASKQGSIILCDVKFWGQSLLWYFVFGAIHELSHVATAYMLGVHHGVMTPDESVLLFLLRITMGRAVYLPMVASDENSYSSSFIIYHSGWLLSLLLAILTTSTTLTKKNKHITTAAAITALEAIATDLLGLGGAVGRGTFLCGNFGLIMINPAWSTNSGDSGTTALKILKKLVEVTMMRGAQTGGVVCWGTKNNELQGIRSRVVNAKRTDLSKGVRDKVYKDAFSGGRLKAGIQGFFGHTRFATSSKATFDGTHPHQWSRPRKWRVYSDPKTMRSKQPEPRPTRVENFITHNGDFDFFRVGRKFYDLHTIQMWLEQATGNPMPATVDSAAIAGLVDLLRTAGSFGLSARYSLLLGSTSSVADSNAVLPSLDEYEAIGGFFEDALSELTRKHHVSIDDISYDIDLRAEFATLVLPAVPTMQKTIKSFAKLVSVGHEENADGIPAHEFVTGTIDAFLDNDLLNTTKVFLENAKGSFGLMFTSSLDASRRICVAARGQTMSVALYPRKGIICYGSEQAAVKAGMMYDCPNDEPYSDPDERSKSFGDKFEDVSVRIDLDDLGGETCLMDWGDDPSGHLVSYPNRYLQQHYTLQRKVRLVLYQESKVVDTQLHHRFTVLEGNEFITPLPDDCEDPVLKDIRDIPRICKNIQENWEASSLNRLTAWNFSRCLRSRLQTRVEGKVPVHAGTLDIVLTGCEVSLWIAEQFAGDLQKAFPKLFIKAVSSNKILGLFGQELSVPSVGYPMSQKTHDLSDTLVIIVSHSGGTFAPLACSNLLQSKTNNIFVVTSEWDTQVGKQLRAGTSDFFSSRIFTTDVGVRPAEPCSLSVVAQHQVLTQLFETISLTILGNEDLRRISGAVITETDLKILERCNRDNINALESIVGMNRQGKPLIGGPTVTEAGIRESGKLWSDHILENARAHIMTFIYIIVTVTIGYPLITGISIGAGIDIGYLFYITRFFDALIYFFLPQINITIIRLVQGRNVLHRMVGRTVVVGDIPWVSQAADAFLSKLFACSYSIAGLNVLSGNPADHLVHRHTHRVVRGSLLVCGRPDGRLSALTSAEATVCLSVSQASSIQSIGGTCESVTIGHNPSNMSLTKKDLFLETHRPLFMCEQLFEESVEDLANVSKGSSKQARNTSPHFLLGTFVGWANEIRSSEKRAYTLRKRSTGGAHHDDRFGETVEKMIREKHDHKRLKTIFDLIDADRNGTLDEEEFADAYLKFDSKLTVEDIKKLFHEIDVDKSGFIDFDEFVAAAALPQSQILRKLDTRNRSCTGLFDAQSSEETYFGQTTRKQADRLGDLSLSESQLLSMELYEGRIASMQRFVAMTVMFHEMGMRVQRFFPRLSFGYLGYNMDRTHSIMRIATTASPVSGSDVRERIENLRLMHVIQKAVNSISTAWDNHRSNDARVLLHARSMGMLEMKNAPENTKAKGLKNSLRRALSVEPTSERPTETKCSLKKTTSMEAIPERPKRDTTTPIQNGATAD